MRPFRVEGDCVLIRLRATPNASKGEISGLWRGPEGETRLVVRVSAPPDKGRANKAVLKLVAKTLGLPKSAVSLTGGERDRAKTVAAAGDLAEIVARLEAIVAVFESGEPT